MINYEHLFPVIPFSFVGAGPCDNDNIVYNTVNCTENFRIVISKSTYFNQSVLYIFSFFHP